MSRRKKTTDYCGQRVLLVGLGLHGGGVATVKWLVGQGALVRVADIKNATDLATSLRKLQGIKATYHLGGYQPSDWIWAQRIVLNPGVPPTIPQVKSAVKRGVTIENEASIFIREFAGQTIGITGTRGKTTTTLLLGEILTAAHRRTIISGNVRNVPMLDYLPSTNADTWAVLELSSYQLERLPVSGHPLHVAVMTNLMVDHVNRHGSLATYAQTKYNIFRGQTKSDWKILNRHNPYCRRAEKIGRGRVQWYGKRLPKKIDGVTVQKGWVVEQKNQTTKRLFSLSTWKPAGDHNLENLLAATAAARAMGSSASVIRRSVALFRGVPYRQELIRTYRGHRFINDTAATSPDATLAALLVYPQGIYILGGTDKALDFSSLASMLVKKNVPTVFLPGNATKKIQTLLRKNGYARPLVTVHSMAAAVNTALALAAVKQDIVLSPGAASFGLFMHEFDRGDKFARQVRQL